MALLMLAVAVLIVLISFSVVGCSSRVRQPLVDVTVVTVEEAAPLEDKVIVQRPHSTVRIRRDK